MSTTVLNTNIVNIFGIRRLEFEFLNEDGSVKTNPEKVYLENVCEKADFKANEKEGDKKELRVWNKTVALAQEDNYIEDGEVSIGWLGLLPELLPKFYGGTYDAATKTYTPPMKSQADTREYFKLTVYAEDKDTNKTTKQYEAHVFPYCKVKTKLPSLSFQNGDYAKPEMVITCDDNVAQVKPMWSYSVMPVLEAVPMTAPMLSGVSTPVAGSATGKTKIVTLPSLGSIAGANHVEYKVATDANAVPTPFVGDVCGGTIYTAGGDITAATGKHIGIAAVDSAGKVLAFVDVVSTAAV